MSLSDPILPTGAELEQLLQLGTGANVDDLLRVTLIDPLEDLISRPRKELRAEVVRIGSRLAQLADVPSPVNSDLLLHSVCEIIELIHMGSLIVDDIQDESEWRRGNRSLHKLYGMPVALNAGNWLYFWPFKKLRMLQVNEEIRMHMYEECHSTMLRAHFGQALDVGVGMDQLERHRISSVCLAAIELKSGALMALALKLGALAASASPSPGLLAGLDSLGHLLGIVLQMHDDLGNLTSRQNPEKRFEDLVRRNPSYVWAVASKLCSHLEYERFVELVRTLPRSNSSLTEWIDQINLIDSGRRLAANYWQSEWTALKPGFPPGIQADVTALMDRLMGSYD